MCGTLTNFLTGSAASGASAATSGILGTAGEITLGQTLSTIGAIGSIAAQTQSTGVESDLLNREAGLIQRQGEFDVQQREDEARKLKSRQIVTSAKSGVSRSGSVLEVMNEAAQIAEEEALNIEFAANSGASAKLFEAKEVKKAGNISAATTALTSFGSLF
jgi:hypothetical protein